MGCSESPLVPRATGSAATPNGYYYFVDRLRDVIRRRAVNIGSLDVETVIAEHPAVAEYDGVGFDPGAFLGPAARGAAPRAATRARAHRPLKTGGRFSTNARMASRESSDFASSPVMPCSKR